MRRSKKNWKGSKHPICDQFDATKIRAESGPDTVACDIKRTKSGALSRKTTVQIAGRGSGFYSPAGRLGQAITEALDPTRAPTNTKTLDTMTHSEIAALEAQYGCPIKRS